MSNGADWIRAHPELAAIIPVARKPSPQSKRAKGGLVLKQPLPPPMREGDVVTLYLPLPPNELRSNGRPPHWSIRHRLTKEHRDMAGLLAKIVAPPKPWERARVDVESWSARKQDPTNYFHGMKAYIDGCGDAGVFVTDAEVEQGNVVQYVGKASDGKRQVVLKISKLEN